MQFAPDWPLDGKLAIVIVNVKFGCDPVWVGMSDSCRRAVFEHRVFGAADGNRRGLPIGTEAFFCSALEEKACRRERINRSS